MAQRYQAQMVAHRRASTLFPMAVMFGALAITTVVVLGATFGPQWGLTLGKVTAFLFLAQFFLDPFTDLPEIYSDTQTAIAGWRKILAVLDLPTEIAEPSPGVTLEGGALDVRADDVRYAYPDGGLVLHGISLHVPAGAHVAIVGETGCGKTTFAKLLTRLADPREGRIEVNGVDLREVAPASRRTAIRMVPQDGFLFDATLRDNVRYGREGSTDRDVETAFEELGLGDWVRVAARGPRHDRGRARRGDVGGRAPVGGARARADGLARPADPGRGHQRRGPGHRAAHQRGTAPAGRRDAPWSRSRTGSPPRRAPTTCSSSTRGASSRRGRTPTWPGAGDATPSSTAAGWATRRRPRPVSDFIDGLRSSAAASLFPTEGTLTLAGLHAPVEVRRDAWGVPYLQAAALDDLWFAQGVLTAGERLFQLDLLLRAANGRLSEVFAERTLADDRFARTWASTGRARRWRRGGRSATARCTGALPRGRVRVDRAPCRRRRSSTRCWICAPELPAGRAPRGRRRSPTWRGDCRATGTSELLPRVDPRARGRRGRGALLPSPPSDQPAVTPGGALHGAIFDALPRTPGQGSNDWVVAGSRTASGKPLLANDPHLPAIQPGVWVEFHLSAPGYRARGVALTFSPGRPAGHHRASRLGRHERQRRRAGPLRRSDSDEDGTAAAYGDAWEPLTVHHETIAVRGSDARHLSTVRATRHGPLLDTFVSGIESPELVALPPEPAYALRWTGADGAGIRPSLAVDAAPPPTSRRSARPCWTVECPGQNFVYADVDGTIGYACSGPFPRCAAPATAPSPVPGWTDEHEWDGRDRRVEDLPWSANPARGFLVTANNRIHDDAYPHLIGHDFHAPYRARRIAERLESRPARTTSRR